MVWWSYIYLAFLAYVGFSSVRSSARRHGTAATSLEFVTSIAWPVLVAAFFSANFFAAVRHALAPLFVVATIWTLYTVWRDFRPSTMMPRLPIEDRNVHYRITLILSAAIVLPVLVLGAIVSYRAI
jgi:hypothetical protein